MLKHLKRNNKETRSYLQGLRQFKLSIPKNIKKILNKKNDIYYEILGKWVSIVGSNTSKISYPMTVTFSKNYNKNSLILIVEKGSEIEIEYSKNDIKNKINSYFGYNLINEIILKTGNLKEKKINNNINYLSVENSVKLKKNVNEIKNKKIKIALEKLIDNIKNNA